MIKLMSIMTVLLVTLGCRSTEALKVATLKVATFNVRTPGDKAPNTWQERCPRIRAIMDSYGFDVMGTQEMTARQQTEIVGKDDVYVLVGCGRDKNRGGEFCPVIYRKDRLDCLASGTFWLSEHPDEPGSRSWKTACPRICTWAKLKDKKTGKEFVFMNTHLDHVSDEARVKGVGVLLERLPQIAGDLPCFLTGDMNSSPNSGAIKAIMTKMTDTRALSETPHAGTIQTFHGYRFNPEKPGKVAIDYIFMRGEIKILSHQTINDRGENGAYPSDHFPVMAEVKF